MREMTLRGLREYLGVRQLHLAPLIEMTQSELSKVERRSDHRVSTLRRFAEALGGELEVVVRLGRERVRLVANAIDAGTKRRASLITNKKKR